jgi:hypothetical protein
MADYCVYWFRKAHEHLPACTAADPVAGRAGLVGTQNIRNNQSRVGGLDYIVRDGTIIEAVENQPWSGEANAHVSIVNWVKTQNPALLPKTRKLWFKVEPSLAAKRIRKRGTGPASKEYELDFRQCTQINSALSDQTDVSGAKALQCNEHPQRCFNGQMIGHEGFLLTPSQREAMLRNDATSAEVLFPYLNGLDALTGAAMARYVLDFEQRNQFEAAAFSAAFDWAKTRVLPDHERKAKEGVDQDGKMRPHHKAFLSRWWQLSFGRPEMLPVIKPLPRYMACAYVTKRPIFMFVSSVIRPSNLIQVFGFADDYSFGLLQSRLHWLWFITKCGKLKLDFRYSAESVFDTFPWPQFERGGTGNLPVPSGNLPLGTTHAPAATKRTASDSLGTAPLPSGQWPDGTGRLPVPPLSSGDLVRIRSVAETAREVRRVRAEALRNLKGGLRALYRTLELPGANPLKDAHAALDAAVLAAYGFNARQDLLAQLLALNLAVAARIERGEPVTAPGIPTGYPSPEKLVTEDCIKPAGS